MAQLLLSEPFLQLFLHFSYLTFTEFLQSAILLTAVFIFNLIIIFVVCRTSFFCALLSLLLLLCWYARRLFPSKQTFIHSFIDVFSHSTTFNYMPYSARTFSELSPLLRCRWFCANTFCRLHNGCRHMYVCVWRANNKLIYLCLDLSL